MKWFSSKERAPNRLLPHTPQNVTSNAQAKNRLKHAV